MTITAALQLLELEAGAAPAEVKAAYRDLVRVWHPDRFETDARLRARAVAKVTQLNAAYRLLTSAGSTPVDPPPRRAAAAMPDRRKRPRPSSPPRRSPRETAGAALAAAAVIAAMAFASVPSWRNTPASVSAPSVVAPVPPAVTPQSLPSTGAPERVERTAALKEAADAAPADTATPAAPALPVSPFTRDVNRVLGQTSR